MAGLEEIIAYTDGACLGNPGPGGYGAILQFDGHERELSAGYRMTTNNRMELLGAIAALETLKRPCRVMLHSDSQYVVRGMTEGWARRWKANGWRRNKGKDPALNADLWDRLLTQCDRHEVTFQWVKGHAGNLLNERADALSVRAAESHAVLIDHGFELPERPPALL